MTCLSARAPRAAASIDEENAASAASAARTPHTPPRTSSSGDRPAQASQLAAAS